MCFYVKTQRHLTLQGCNFAWLFAYFRLNTMEKVNTISLLIPKWRTFKDCFDKTHENQRVYEKIIRNIKFIRMKHDYVRLDKHISSVAVLFTMKPLICYSYTLTGLCKKSLINSSLSSRCANCSAETNCLFHELIDGSMWNSEMVVFHFSTEYSSLLDLFISFLCFYFMTLWRLLSMYKCYAYLRNIKYRNAFYFLCS